MKHLLLIAISFCLGMTAQANDELAASMKIMGAQFKIIGNALGAKKISESDVTAANTLEVEIEKASHIFPDLATTDELKKQYTEDMTELLAKSVALSDEMAAQLPKNPQDLTLTTAIFKEMNAIKVSGHEQFHPQ